MLVGSSCSSRFLIAVLVVGDADRLHTRQVEAVQIRGVLALRVVPEHDPVALEAALQVRADRGDVTHSLASRPGIFFSAAPNFG